MTEYLNGVFPERKLAELKAQGWEEMKSHVEHIMVQGVRTEVVVSHLKRTKPE